MYDWSFGSDPAFMQACSAAGVEYITVLCGNVSAYSPACLSPTQLNKGAWPYTRLLSGAVQTQCRGSLPTYLACQHLYRSCWQQNVSKQHKGMLLQSSAWGVWLLLETEVKLSGASSHFMSKRGSYAALAGLHQT